MKSSEYLTSLFSLTGKVAVVSGGTGELCGAMAEGLAGAGAEVVLVGRNAEKAEARLAKIRTAGGKGYFISAEASSKAELEKLLATVLAQSGRVDIVVIGTSDLGTRGGAARRPVHPPRARPVAAAGPDAEGSVSPARAASAGSFRLSAAAAARAAQEEFAFGGETESRGYFDKTDRNLFEGQDLDVPTYFRKGIKIVL